MSWRDAPLYVEAHDLAVWLLGQTSSWSPHHNELAVRVSAHVCDLVGDVALALTFPAGRRGHLEAADQTAVRLRMELRLAQGVGQLSARRMRYVSSRLDSVGRMIGGWRKRLERRRGALLSEKTETSGDGPPAARG